MEGLWSIVVGVFVAMRYLLNARATLTALIVWPDPPQ